MYTMTHGLISARTGEPVRIVFTVTDNVGASVIVSGGSAVYKIARRKGQSALLAKTELDGITLSGDTVAVDFDTGDIQEDGLAVTGDFFGQLTVTLNGEGLVVAEGPLNIGAVIV